MKNLTFGFARIHINCTHLGAQLNVNGFHLADVPGTIFLPYLPSERLCVAMLAGSLITQPDMSLGTPGAAANLTPSCCDQLEAANTTFWVEGSSGERQAEAVFSASVLPKSLQAC